MRVAAIDCGTNTIRLLILEKQEENLRELRREMRIVRLGEGVDASGKFAPSALARTFAATREYAGIISELAVDNVAFIATSASRDVHNRAKYEAGIQKILGVSPQVISGNQEAALTFGGVLSGLSGVEEPVMVVDIGGGSTEFISGDKTGIISAISTDMGSVRLYERYLEEILKSSEGSLNAGISVLSMEPTEAMNTTVMAGIDVGKSFSNAMAWADLSSEEIEQAKENFPQTIAWFVQKTRLEVQQWLEKAAEMVDFSQVRTLVGVAGTITSITAKAMGLKEYDSEAINGAALDCQQVLDSCQWMMSTTIGERCELGFMDKHRADVIGVGALIWQEIITYIQEKTSGTDYPLQIIYTSEHDILDGIALEMLQETADE